jgi:hypothetical protein
VERAGNRTAAMDRADWGLISTAIGTATIEHSLLFEVAIFFVSYSRFCFFSSSAMIIFACFIC